MSVLAARPLRWIAAGVAALIVTIYSALMLGLNVPAIRAVPLAPWAEGGFGADRHADLAVASAPASAVAHAPSRVAGVRFPAEPGDPRHDDAPPAAPVPEAPVPPAAPVEPLPAVPPLPALPTPTLPALDPIQG